MSDAVRHRGLISMFCMMGVLMVVLDSTISIVALPYMQGSLSATMDQITWVISSYIIVSAIMTAPVGWLANRFGRKNLYLTCIVGFTCTTILAGAAQSLEQMIACRILQGTFGAALVPLSQATMLDIFPAEQRARAMAYFGMGVMIGPIMGPTLGGYLTEWFHWRWVFYVNVPLGIAATAGLALLMPASMPQRALRFDWTGFAVLALGVGSMQIMLDRGSLKDWFTSSEIIIAAVLGGLGIYLFVVHMLTAEKPFIPRELFRDRNFTTAMLVMFASNTVMMSSSTLLAPYLQKMSGYPVADAGMLLAPRGFGTMAAMLICSRLGTFTDQRKLIAIGLSLLSLTLYDMSTWTPDVSQRWLVAMMLVQGVAMGLIWNPLTVVSFSTLGAQLRGDAAAVQSLGRNIGAAVGISITTFSLSHWIQASHAGLAASITPFTRAIPGEEGARHFLDATTRHGAVMLDKMINREAMIIAYSNDFLMMSLVAIPCMALVLMMKKVTAPGPPAAPRAPQPPPQGRSAVPAEVSAVGGAERPSRAAAAPSR
ncbi:MAG: DHA2 family efflux MFS transporter permease subunit [Alphaproteobacteria bacterium]|nr:DHA2 family efflux MFS transporter permease subunit [Alphaproteobacteria bacterium]